MGCRNCGVEKTIRAHLFPRTLTREIQVGSAHVTNAHEGGKFFPTQSGTFDPDILCAACDQQLGYVEESAAKILAEIREDAKGYSYGVRPAFFAESNVLLRFCAAILWKFSITRREFGRIPLGPYQDVAKNIAFGVGSIPMSFDAALFREIKDRSDTSAVYYRNPVPMRFHGLNFIRFSIGGVTFLIKIDKRVVQDELVKSLWLRGRSVYYRLVPIELSGDFQAGRRLAFGNSPLGSFLEKQEARTGGGQI